MLILPIKKVWFNMILSGEKKEEYRTIKPYWTKRFMKIFARNSWNGRFAGTDMHEVIFRNGYGKNAPSFTARCTLKISKGKESWGAEPNEIYYVLTILEILNIKE